MKTGPGACAQFPRGLVSGLLRSEPGAILVQENREGGMSEKTKRVVVFLFPTG